MLSSLGRSRPSLQVGANACFTSVLALISSASKRVYVASKCWQLIFSQLEYCHVYDHMANVALSQFRIVSLLSPISRTINPTCYKVAFRFRPMTSSAWIPNRYPQARRSDHIDIYKSESKGEVKVHDPYRWLEDNESEETGRWVSAQEEFTRQYLDSCKDRQKLEDAIRKSTDYPKVSTLPICGRKSRFDTSIPSSRHLH